MTLDPEVSSQMSVLVKAREGLKHAQEMLTRSNEIIKLFPDDKTAVRAKQEAERMVERFKKHEAAAHKIITTLSKKAIPPALKKEADAAAKAIKARLVDPDALEVIPWQRETSTFDRVPPVKVVEYQMVFRLKGVPDEYHFSGTHNAWMLIENTGISDAKVESWQNGNLKAGGTTGKDFAANLLERLKGWAGIKGESEATAARASTAQAIARALNSVITRGWDKEPATVSKDNITIEAAYRSDLPKEGASSVGEYEYEEMVEREVASCRKLLDPKLAPYKNQIDRVNIHDGEKSWIYISVRLK